MPSEDPGVIVTPVASRGAYQVVFNGNDMGLVDDVDPTKSVLMFEDITTGSTGKKNVIGLRFVGAKVLISVEFRQITVAMQRALCSWGDQSSGSTISLTPPLNSDLYQFAQPLLLHPTDRSDTLMDVQYDHAVCTKVPLMKRDNGKDDVVAVEFQVFPDRPGMNTSTGVSTLDQGYIKGS